MSALIARLSTPATVNGVVAFVTGVISTWSSTSGVVLPAFLPTVPSLVARLGGGDPLAVSLSINVGSSLVDVSPLSTLGALCISALAEPGTARVLFRQLMAWGLSMTVVGALFCQLFAGLLAGSSSSPDPSKGDIMNGDDDFTLTRREALERGGAVLAGALAAATGGACGVRRPQPAAHDPASRHGPLLQERRGAGPAHQDARGRAPAKCSRRTCARSSASTRR